MNETDTSISTDTEFVIDVAETRISDLWKKEDYWAIWLGFLILIFGLVVYFNNAPADMTEKIKQANSIMAIQESKAPLKP